MHKGEDIMEVIIDKSSVTILCVFNNSWLSHYPKATSVLHDHESKFKLHFKALCKSYSLVCKPTLIKNPQANGILECIYAVNSDMMHTSNLDSKPQHQQRV